MVGGTEEGGKAACGLLETYNHTKQDDIADCIILMVGSNNIFQFEEAVFNETNCIGNIFEK